MTLRKRSIFCGLCALASVASAQPFLDGSKIEDLEGLAFPPNQDGLTCTDVVWSFRVDAPVFIANIKRPELKVHFGDLVMPESDDFFIEVADTSGNVVETLDRAFLEGRSELWSLSIPSIAAQVAVYGCGALEGLAFDLDMIAFPFDFTELESLYGQRDLIDTRSYDGENSEIVLSSASSVARISIIQDRNETYCSGFRVGHDLVQTSSHCLLPEADFCDTTQVWFDYHDTDFGLPSRGQQLRCVEIVNSVPLAGADTTVLRVHPAPEDNVAIVSFASETPDEGALLFIPQHPGGLTQKLAIADCTRQEDERTSAHASAYGHTCDTLPGSSGSPVFNSQGEVVGQHRAGHTNPDVTDCLNLATHPDLLDFSTPIESTDTEPPPPSVESC